MRCFAIDLTQDLRDHARTDGVTTFADGEAQPLFDHDRSDELDREGDVVAGHDHLGGCRELGGTGQVGRLDVELRAVALEERRVTAALFLAEHVRLGLELRVRLHAAGLRDHLAALDVRALETAEEEPDVVAGLALVEELAEHLDAGDDGLLRLADAEDLDVLADLDRAAVDTTGGDGTAALDAEDVLDGHLERLVLLADRGRDVRVDRVHELEDRLELGRVDVRRLALERLARRATDDRRLRAVE